MKYILGFCFALNIQNSYTLVRLKFVYSNISTIIMINIIDTIVFIIFIFEYIYINKIYT